MTWPIQNVENYSHLVSELDKKDSFWETPRGTSRANSAKAYSHSSEKRWGAESRFLTIFQGEREVEVCEGLRRFQVLRMEAADTQY